MERNEFIEESLKKLERYGDDFLMPFDETWCLAESHDGSNREIMICNVVENSGPVWRRKTWKHDTKGLEESFGLAYDRLSEMEKMFEKLEDYGYESGDEFTYYKECRLENYKVLFGISFDYGEWKKENSIYIRGILCEISVFTKMYSFHKKQTYGIDRYDIYETATQFELFCFKSIIPAIIPESNQFGLFSNLEEKTRDMLVGMKENPDYVFMQTI